MCTIIDLDMGAGDSATSVYESQHCFSLSRSFYYNNNNNIDPLNYNVSVGMEYYFLCYYYI